MKKHLYYDLEKIEKNHWWHVNKRTLVTSIIKDNFSKKIKSLDIGCGTGSMVRELSQFGASWGLDPSGYAINICKKNKIKNVKKSKAEKTPFKKSDFNVVTALDVLEHANDKKIIPEAHRILKPNGIFIITVPAYPWMWSKWDDQLMHKRRYYKKDLINLLQKNNFKIIKSTYQHSFLILPVYLIRKIKDQIYNKNNYPSDFLLINSQVNTILKTLADYELALSKKVSIPFGLSILIIAKKNEK